MLCLLNFASLSLRNPTILRSYTINIIQIMVDFVTSLYINRIPLFYLLAFPSLARASSFENEPSFGVTCDNSSMHLSVEFLKPFNGLIFTSGNAFVSECSFPTSNLQNDTRLEVTLAFWSCNFTIGVIDEERTSISSTVIVQQHPMLATSYDVYYNATCELSVPIDVIRQLNYPNATITDGRLHTDLPSTPLIKTWIETRIGSDFFQNHDSEELFFVINVRDGGMHKDMFVRNCIAHDNRVLTNDTLLYQMSDVYGCSDEPHALSNFTIKTNVGRTNLMAYTQIGDLAYTLNGEFFVTCGVVLCEDKCSACSDSNSTMPHLSGIAEKSFAGRLPGATLPPSLNLFETRQRISKRSIEETLRRWFSLSSSDAKIEQVVIQEINGTSEASAYQYKNSTDLFNITNISKDSQVNKTKKVSYRPNYKVTSIWPEFTVCVAFILLVSCYGGLLYSNAKRNPNGSAVNVTELYSIVY